ncbi:MAG: ribonuclease R [Planctomycetes bacterium GWF2_50_10]|nr:MAG: ribonuclease R [Planctomycetes bacterium GWF2_50_10]
MPLKLHPLAKALGVEDDQFETFAAAFKELYQAGRVVIGAKNLISLPPPSSKMVGKFRSNPKGFGFVIPLEPNAQGDLFIPPGATMEAMTGDTVEARVTQRGKRSGKMQYNGEIIAILERGHDQLVGTLNKENGQWFVKPDGNTLLEPVSVDDVTAKNAQINDKVVIEIIAYPSEKYLARGVIIEVLGKAGLYDSEIRSVIKQFHLPEEFPSQCIEQSRQAANDFSPDTVESRDDISDQVVITIDPPDAKDFDDAISLVRNLDGNWVLGVHIADVSTFIAMNSPLDIEARERGNSAYLPGKTIPMLPEILSNGICSLQPNQRRFVKSAYITYDNDGHVLGRDFANSIIKSFERLTYERAYDIINGQVTGEKPEVVSLLKDMEHLAQAIEKRRDRQGAIHLNLPEIELILDKQGKVIDAEPAENSYPHTIIEMFMVEANEAVAALLDRFRVPFMRRIHPDPDSISTNNLIRFVSLCGIKIPRKLDRRAIQDLLAFVHGTPAELPINLHVLRSLTRAEYSPLHIGHYALASEHYCHFTSPIRRYADLLVHRLLQCYLEQRLNMIGLEEVLPDAELIEIGKHISFTEQRANDAEGELKKVLLLQMLSEHIGESLDCVVSGLTNFGIFVQSTRFGIDGLIPFEQLSDDEWRYDDHRHCAVSKRAGKMVHLGDPMVCQIVSVNISARQLSLAPLEPLTETEPKPKKAKYQATRTRRTSDRRRSTSGRIPDRRKAPRRKK